MLLGHDDKNSAEDKTHNSGLKIRDHDILVPNIFWEHKACTPMLHTCLSLLKSWIFETTSHLWNPTLFLLVG